MLKLIGIAEVDVERVMQCLEDADDDLTSVERRIVPAVEDPLYGERGNHSSHLSYKATP